MATPNSKPQTKNPNRRSSSFRPDDDLDAAIELLFFDRAISRHDETSFAVTLGLDSVRLYAHIFDQPCFHGLCSALA